MKLGTIQEIWRYPVKSMFGEQVQQARIERMGLPEDRTWALRDEESGDIVGGKKIPGIMTLRARYTNTPSSSFSSDSQPAVEILFPDGRSMLSSDPHISALLSMYLGRRVTLCQRLPASEKAHYALANAPSVQETRYALGIRPDEENPDLSTFSLGLLATLSRYATPPGTYYDVYPLHFLTTASLQTMQAHYPGGEFRVERYRPSFVIETSPQFSGLVETTLTGARLKIGECIIDCNHPTIRCSMPGAAQPGMAADPGIPMAVMRHANRHLGAYATPHVNGSIKVGDSVEILPRRLRGLFNGIDSVGRKFRKSLLDTTAKLEQKQVEKKRAGNAAKTVVNTDSPRHPPGFRPFTLTRTEDEAPGIRSFYFSATEPAATCHYLPGQHVVLALKNPNNGQLVYRPYTVSNANTGDNSLRISVKHEVAPPGSGFDDGLASSILHQHCEVGQEIHFKGPIGNFATIPTDHHPLVLISGGIGITPFVAMLQTLADENPKRQVQLFHSIRELSDLAFADTLRQLNSALPNLNVALHLTGANDEGADARLPSVRGRLSAHAIANASDIRSAHYYVCGKPGFSAELVQNLEQCGIEQDRIHHESFGQPRQQTRDPDTSQREIRFASSGQVSSWNGDHSLLELAEGSGIPVASGCRYGACHACQATLVAGDYTYPEGVEPPTAKSQVLLCCMQPQSDIVLDL